MALIGAAVGLWWSATRSSGGAPPPPSAASASPAAYVDDKVCKGCHEDEGRQWETSHHAQAMALATEQTVLGDFRNTVFVHKGIRSRFFRRGDRFLVNTEGPDGKAADFEIRYTFGVQPLQQYLIELPGGRLQPLSIAWDSPRKRWFHLLPNETTPPGDVLHWTGRYQTANTMCLVCHTTDFEKNYDARADVFASRWAEPNVSCQSCHGPGETHVQWETSVRGAGTPVASPPDKPHGLTVDIKAADARTRTELCAPCHSRRSEIAPTPQPGEPLLDNFLPSLLVQGLYHADGQQLDEVYVDGSFRQSKMFQQGVTCTHCHNPHSGKLKLEGNAVCVQCHRPDPNPSFPTASGAFDAPSHHFHKPGSEGAQCVNCHMPKTTYMQIQHRPDHSIRVPRPDLSSKIGTPDACTQCHTNKKAQWAATTVAQWYGPERRQEAHYGEAFAMARAGSPDGYASLARLVANPQTPDIVRATALAELRQDPLNGVAERTKATLDPNPEVRAAAADSMEGLSATQRLETLTPMLSDPIRAVRIAAARNLASLSAQLAPGAKPAFDAALREYIEAQTLALDMPGAQFNLALLYESTGRRDLAEQHYLGALKVDPDFTPARANLAMLYSASSRNPDAERVLSEGVRRRPEVGDLQYSLGLLLAEEKRMEEALQALGKAARLLPNRANVHYNYGVALQQAGRGDEAEAALLTAQRLAPDDPSTPYALAVFYSQTGRRGKALEWAEKLRQLRPMDRQVARLIAELERTP